MFAGRAFCFAEHIHPVKKNENFNLAPSKSNAHNNFHVPKQRLSEANNFQRLIKNLQIFSFAKFEIHYSKLFWVYLILDEVFGHAYFSIGKRASNPVLTVF